MTPLLFLIALIAQVADVWTTRDGLREGGVEANPAIAFLMSRLGRRWALVKVVAAGLAQLYALYEGAWWVVVLVTAATAFVAWRNARVV